MDICRAASAGEAIADTLRSSSGTGWPECAAAFAATAVHATSAVTIAIAAKGAAAAGPAAVVSAQPVRHPILEFVLMVVLDADRQSRILIGRPELYRISTRRISIEVRGKSLSSAPVL
jgi:hypothetical protein